MAPKLDLTSVTICAADCVNPALAARALCLSLRDCVFGDAILFTDRPQDGPFRVEPIAPLRSRADYSRFMLRDLHHRVTTPFVLVVQWDGYVLDSRAWAPQFFDYDYIGAPWPWFPDRRVGNGGFSLRSRRLLRAAASMPALAEDVNEDVAICRSWAPALERDHGIRFAPQALAEQFSYERLLPDMSTFGFHGLFNMWRHLSDDALVSVAMGLDQTCLGGVDYLECLLTCFFQRRFPPLAALYGRLREIRSVEEVRTLVGAIEPDRATVDMFLSVAAATLRTASPARDPLDRASIGVV